MPIDMRVRYQCFHEGMEDALVYQFGHLGALLKDAAQADVGTFHQGSRLRFLQIEERSHLVVQVLVCEGISGDLVTQEVADDLFGIDDRVEHTGQECQWGRVNLTVSVLTFPNEFRLIFACTLDDDRVS
jgi:hypothetical protein